MSLCRAQGSRGTAGWVPAVGTGSWEAVRPGLGRSSVVLAVFWGFAPVPVLLLPQPWLLGAAGWVCGERACGWAVAGCDGAGGDAARVSAANRCFQGSFHSTGCEENCSDRNCVVIVGNGVTMPERQS